MIVAAVIYLHTSRLRSVLTSMLLRRPCAGIATSVAAWCGHARALACRACSISKAARAPGGQIDR